MKKSTSRYNVLRQVFAIVIGWFGGAIINMLFVQLGHVVFPLEGIDPSDMEAYADVLPSLEFKYFIFPFLAHAIGTLSGSVIAGLIAVRRKMLFAFITGVLFLLGGIWVNIMLPGPEWFAVVDILLAYLPMAWLGGKLAIALSKNQ